MTTEAEAKNLWCPMAKHPTNATTTQARAFREALCIGHTCMMWRWDGQYKATKAGPVRTGDSEHGYCGLAGKP